MQNTTTGTILSVKKQWWLKIRTKSITSGVGDDAIYPHVLKVRYTVDGIEYIRNKWILTKKPIPQEGDTVRLTYDDRKPERIKLVL